MTREPLPVARLVAWSTVNPDYALAVLAAGGTPHLGIIATAAGAVFEDAYLKGFGPVSVCVASIPLGEAHGWESFVSIFSASIGRAIAEIEASRE